MSNDWFISVLTERDEVETFVINDFELNHLHYCISKNINFFSYKQGEGLHYLNLNRVIKIKIASADGDVEWLGNI